MGCGGYRALRFWAKFFVLLIIVWPLNQLKVRLIILLIFVFSLSFWVEPRLRKIIHLLPSNPHLQLLISLRLKQQLLTILKQQLLIHLQQQPIHLQQLRLIRLQQGLTRLHLQQQHFILLKLQLIHLQQRPIDLQQQPALLQQQLILLQQQLTILQQQLVLLQQQLALLQQQLLYSMKLQSHLHTNHFLSMILKVPLSWDIQL